MLQNLNPEEEVITLLLNCRDPSLRDYLFTNKRKDITDELINAWEFLILLESVLTNFR